MPTRHSRPGVSICKGRHIFPFRVSASAARRRHYLLRCTPPRHAICSRFPNPLVSAIQPLYSTHAYTTHLHSSQYSEGLGWLASSHVTRCLLHRPAPSEGSRLLGTCSLLRFAR